MKIDICSRDMEFLRSCRSALEAWSGFVCVDIDVSLYERWEDLPGTSGNVRSMLFLDAEHVDLSQNQEHLENIRAGYGALFVCSQESKKAIALYRLRPTAFLRRPLSAASLDQAMSRCVSVWQTGLQNLELTENRSRLKVPMCDILWAEVLGRSCLLHCLCRDIQIGESMNELVSQLPGAVFIRCQRSYLVNLHHVKSVDGKFVYMSNGEAISIGRSTRSEVMSAVAHYRERWNEQMG